MISRPDIVKETAKPAIEEAAKPAVETASEEKATPMPEPPDGHEAVIKRRFVLPDQSKSAQHDDRKEDSDKQAGKAVIFAPGNENPATGIIPAKSMTNSALMFSFVIS